MGSGANTQILRLNSKGEFLSSKSCATKLKEGSKIGAVGSFDGIHLGHQRILDELSLRAQGRSSCIVTFYPHPSLVLGKVSEIPALTPNRKRLELLSSKNISLMALIHFSMRFADISYEDFVQKILFENLNIKHLLIGPDARFGRKGLGGPQEIVAAGRRLGMTVEVIEGVNRGGTKIGSREVRDLIRAGELEEASTLLGRNYSLLGRVKRGNGRNFVFKTASLHCPKQVIPPRGVYASITRLNGDSFLSVANIGIQPTFNGKSVSIENHLIDYKDRDLYGERMEILFVTKIREERRFDSIEALKEQVSNDIIRARSLLKEV